MPVGQDFQELHLSSKAYFEKWEAENQLQLSQLSKNAQYKLGHYAEALLSFFFHNHPRFDLIYENQQVIIDGRTIGEVDFIIKDLELNKTLHIELALKYYMLYDASKGLHGFLGPSAHDNLGAKLEHLQKHQSQLVLKHPEAFPLVKDQEIESQIWMKGRLFFPPNHTAQLDAQLNPDLPKGTWSKDLNLAAKPLHKLDWISGKPNKTEYPETSYPGEMYCLENEWYYKPSDSWPSS